LEIAATVNLKPVAKQVLGKHSDTRRIALDELRSELKQLLCVSMHVLIRHVEGG